MISVKRLIATLISLCLTFGLLSICLVGCEMETDGTTQDKLNTKEAARTLQSNQPTTDIKGRLDIIQ